MSSLRAKLIDRNRYAKRYPLVRSPARYSYVGDSDMAIEVGSVYLTDSDSGTFTFEVGFPDSNYQAFAVARDDGSGQTSNVNVFVTSKTSSYVNVQASSNFTGYIDVFVVRVV